jgi:hypothetical protein
MSKIENLYESDTDFLNQKFGIINPSRLIVPLGGWCGTATQTRGALKINVLALPFDYLISTFNAIISVINNNFNNFFDNPKTIKVGPDTTFLTNKYFYWIHHDITKKCFRNSYKDRINRFIKLLNSDKEIIFIRSCVENITKELESLDDFYKMIKEKKIKSWKLILVTHNYHVKTSENISLKMNINNQIHVFCINDFPKKSNDGMHNFYDYPDYINFNLRNLMITYLKEEENKYILNEWTEEEKKEAPYRNGYTGNTYDSHTL